jgi:hypothetical protein
VARCLRALNRPAEALVLLRQLEADADGYVWEELGECVLLTAGDAKAAAPYFARAYDALSQDAKLMLDEPERLARLQALGQG